MRESVVQGNCQREDFYIVEVRIVYLLGVSWIFFLVILEFLGQDYKQRLQSRDGDYDGINKMDVFFIKVVEQLICY